MRTIIFKTISRPEMLTTDYD